MKIVLDHTTRCVAFDVSSFFSGKFVDPLIGQLKSTNSQVRDESLSFFETLSSKSSDEACLKKVVDQVSNALLTKGPTPEQRIVYFTALKGLPRIQGLSKHLLESMVKLFAKESNESALSALLSCVAAHANCASATLSPDYIQLINIGVKDPKSGVRILYLQVLESLLFEDIDFGKDATAMLDSLFKLAQNVQASGIALLDPKKETPLLSEAIIAIRTLLRSPLALKTSQSVKALETFLLSRQSFFFNEKLYSKLVSTPDDFDVFTEVLFLAFRSGKVVKASDSPLFGPMAWSVLYAPPASYRSNLKKLQSIVSEESSVEKLQILIQGFQSAFEVLLFEHSRALKPDGGVAWPGPPPRSSNIFGVRVYEALQAILPKPPLSSTRLETLILQMAVILSHSLVSSVVGTDAWVRLAFSIGLVPQELITRDAEAMIKVWLGHTEADAIKGVIIPCQPPAASLFRDATLAAVSLFTDIQPALLCSSVIPWCLDRLSINTLGSLSLEDIRTWMVPEGELFFDPVTQFQKKRDSSHQPKTADEKWEMELRKELKSKGGAKSNKDVKLSKADKDLVTLQMAKETAIRKTVTSVRHDIITAIDLFDAVLRGVNKSIAAEALESFEVHLASVLASVWGNLECLHRISQQQDSKISDPVLNGSKMADLIRNIYKLFRDCPAGLFPDDIFCAVIRAKGLGHCISHAGELTLNMSKDLNVFLTQILSQFEEALDISNQLSAFDFALLFPLLQAIIMKEGDIENFKSQAYTEFALTTSDILMLHCGIDGSASTLSRHAILGSMIVLLKQFPLLHSAGRDSISALLISATDSTYDDDEASTERRAKASTGMMTSLYNTLLSELLTSNEGVRQSCLFGLSHMAAPTTDVKLRDTCIWMLRRDPCEDIQLEAERLWIELYNDSCITKDCIHLLIEMTGEYAGCLSKR